MEIINNNDPSKIMFTVDMIPPPECGLIQRNFSRSNGVWEKHFSKLMKLSSPHHRESSFSIYVATICKSLVLVHYYHSVRVERYT